MPTSAVRRESIVQGTLTIAISILFVRVISFLYRPVVVRLFQPFDGSDGWTGMGLAQAPATAYLIALAFTSTGFNVAISRLVSERMALGDSTGARRVFRTSLALMLGLGILGALFFYLGAPWLEATGEMAGTAPGYRAMAPAVLVMSVVAAFRGLLTGLRSMKSNAFSQLLEAIVRFAIGLTLVHLLVARSVPLAAAGFNLGDFAGAVAALLYYLALYWRNRKQVWQTEPGINPPQTECGVDTPACTRTSAQPSDTLRAILRVGLPMALLGAAPPLMMYADNFVLGRSLPGASAGFVSAVYGQLSSGLSIVWVPAVLTGALATTLVPAMTEALAQKRAADAGRYAALAYRATLLLGWPAMVGLGVLATPICQFIFRSAAGADLLLILAAATVPIMLQQTSSGILQGMGHLAPSVYGLAVGTALKVVLTLLLVPRFGPAGAAWGTVVGFGAPAVLNMLSLRRLLGFRTSWKATLLKPGLASLTMGVLVSATWQLAGRSIHAPWARNLALLLVIGFGVLLYTVLLLAMHALTRDDADRIPLVGPVLARFIR